MTVIKENNVLFSGTVLEEKLPDDADWTPSIFFVEDNKVVYSLNLNEQLHRYVGKNIEITVREIEDEA